MLPIHSYLVSVNKHKYTSAGDAENADHSISHAMLRSDPQLQSLERTCHNRHPTRSTKEQRELLTNYFCNAGAVPWQDNREGFIDLNAYTAVLSFKGHFIFTIVCCCT